SGYNGILMQDASASSQIVALVGSGTLPNLRSLDGGALVLGAMNMINGLGARGTSYIEMGGFWETSPISAMSDNYGRAQIAVSSGEPGQSMNSVGWRGWALTGKKAWPTKFNFVNGTYTNGSGTLWYLDGYSHVADSPNATTYSVGYVGFAGVSN